MSTTPDKCPKCGASQDKDIQSRTVYGCGSTLWEVRRDLSTEFEESELCLMTQRAQRAEAELAQSRAAWNSLNDQIQDAFLKLRNAKHRAEKWKAFGIETADRIQGVSDEDCALLNRFDALMKEKP